MSLARSLDRRQTQHARRVARSAARRVRFPTGFEGGVMWCPKCGEQLRMIPKGTALEPFEQQQIADGHRAACKPRKVY